MWRQLLQTRDRQTTPLRRSILLPRRKQAARRTAPDSLPYLAAANFDNGDVMNAVERGYVPADWLRHHDLQALISSGALRRRVVRRRTSALDASEFERVLHCGDGVRLQAFEHRHGGRRRPLLIGIHGWHGCHDATYMRSAAGALFAAGFDLVRLNLRDHGDSVAWNEGLFHSCLLEEVQDAVDQLIDGWSQVPVGLFGFSLGGNFALRVAAARPRKRIAKVIALCPVLDPAVSLLAMDYGRWFYRWWFVTKWKRALDAKQAAFPHLYNFANAMSMTSLTQMTDYLVSRFTDFPNTASYMRSYSLVKGGLADLEIPARILLSEDDPMVPVESRALLPDIDALQVDVSSHGGHCGFLLDHRLHSWQDAYLLRCFSALLGSSARREQPAWNRAVRVLGYPESAGAG